MSLPRSVSEPTRPLPLFEIVHTARLADRLFAETFSEHELVSGQFGVLACVNDSPGITQAEIAQALFVRPQTVARPVAGLIEQGMLRAGLPRGRGGATPLFVTDTGRARLDEAWPDIAALNMPRRLGLTADEAATLVRLLTTVREHSILTEK